MASHMRWRLATPLIVDEAGMAAMPDRRSSGR